MMTRNIYHLYPLQYFSSQISNSWQDQAMIQTHVCLYVQFYPNNLVSSFAGHMYKLAQLV